MDLLNIVDFALTHNERLAVRAAMIVPMRGERPARGLNLFAPLKVLRDHWLLISEGRIDGFSQNPPPNFQKHDLGDVAILPPLANCHTHLQLSWLGGQTVWGQGFTAWLKSMLPLLMPVIAAGFAAPRLADALAAACASLEPSTYLVGDVGGSIKGALTATRRAAADCNLGVSHFCECFGFAKQNGPWPERCVRELAAMADPAPHCAPAGHGLYSTSPQTLRNAHEYCKSHGLVFSFHLAESPDETELLTSGSGPLAELYKGAVLPSNWNPPGMRPAAYAQSLGLLAPKTLAVHCVHLDKAEISMLGSSGAAICLCPRSNRNLGVGFAPVRDIVASGALVCLGTDGLTSNSDLDIRNEAFHLRETEDLPLNALWRMATVNGAGALNRPFTGLEAGAPAKFSIWPEVGDV